MSVGNESFVADIPQYTIPKPQKLNQKQSGSVLLSPKRQKIDEKRKAGKQN